ncbi:3-isopropylmalate dehydratase small subunit [Acidaminobacter sp. JC074]|uniref:3-isopropylmalate dehydratase small subunit n=1 Tax=Acidaminobacter sp. JC074 TaxID=2530199 RepID=UPI001F10129B|nr:3-isopropylmalate dehydratase small subunit [Acidaminobacter sp. JC074]MCH4890582.1 3-isopropylmalate dehydratase small subunit [Acidaminobacter sp. JC074]
MSKLHIYGDHIDTDIIIPAHYLNVHDPEELKKHCMEGVDEAFDQRVSIGDIMIAGENFGCGSSREHAPVVIKASGISCVIAKSFARIFFRNAFNIGLPVIESSEIVDEVSPDDKLSIDFKSGKVINETKNKSYTIPKFPDFMMALIEAGGVIPYIKEADNV